MMDGLNGLEASSASKDGFDSRGFCTPDVQVISERDLKKLTQGPLRTLLNQPNDQE